MAPAMMMGGVTQPTIMATRCCNAREMAVPTGGTPRGWNSSARRPEVSMVRTPFRRAACRGMKRPDVLPSMIPCFSEKANKFFDSPKK